MARGYHPRPGDTVRFRDVDGKGRDAVVTSRGAGANQLNLRVPHKGAAGLRQITTNTDKATTRTQTGVWSW